MPLLVSLDRGTSVLELGAHQVLVLKGDELHRVNGDKRLLARHRHNRWMRETDADPFVRLNINGPLVLVAPDSETKLGP